MTDWFPSWMVTCYGGRISNPRFTLETVTGRFSRTLDFGSFFMRIFGERCLDSLAIHLCQPTSAPQVSIHVSFGLCARVQTFLKVLRPARMLPPVHVVYLRSGGAKILIRISLTASLWTSCSNRSPNPFVSVVPPDSNILPYKSFRKSISVRCMESTII